MKVYTPDIVVIGAGPNGLAAALALGSHGLLRRMRVMVIDPNDPRKRGSKADSRGSALAQATQSMFRAVGIWDHLKDHAQEIRDIIVTDDALDEAERTPLLSFSTDQDMKAAAAMVENHHLLKALVAGVEASPEIELLTGLSVTDFQLGPGKAVLRLSNGAEVKAPLVVAADGRNSPARVAANIACDERSYDQSAITLTVEHELPHEGHAEEHFTPQGVFAVLPLTGDRSSIVWTEGHVEAQRIVALSDAKFLSELRLRFGAHRGKLKLGSPRHCYPLSLLVAKSFVAPRLALVGDAAHVLHPLAGLGLNLGFKDAAALADVVTDAAALGEDIGSVAVLERYQSQRRFDTHATVALIDGMNRLFANDNSLLKLIRDTGLRVVNRIQPAKKILMDQAAGTSGNVPRLMRGNV